MELIIASNPDPDSRLPYLLWVPLGQGLVFRTSGTWPRTKALYCHAVSAAEWPGEPEVVERIELQSCIRRGAAVDVVAARSRENRSQLVYTTARGRDVVFWQSARTRKQARPGVRTPAARAAGIVELPIVIDSRERYAYDFAGKSVRTARRVLPCGDYGLVVDDRLAAAVERKSLSDFTSSLLSGRLKYQLTELAGLPRAAVVVEDRYSQIYTGTHAKPATVADAIAEVQIAFPNVPVVFCDTRKLAQEYTYRYLAACQSWFSSNTDIAARLGDDHELAAAPAQPGPSTAEVRAWARENGFGVPARGRLRPEVWSAWSAAHRS
ncbi:ERCC4 domain-containing protein [Rhodococcus sp. NPDC058521]|uniref:ERCC4 domain-containing protein n=1 Tax=Rhodococcus sp. NPDC058521 TaxID=3346536 RepID=UPI0036658A68